MNNRSLYRITGLILIPLFLAVSRAANPAEIDGNLLQELKKSVTLDAATLAVMNAVSNNDIDRLTLNRELLNTHNQIFNVTTDARGITDQKSSGRCWIFAGLNILRPAIIKKHNLDSFEFSQTYLFFWDKLEKYNFFLEAIIETRDRDIQDRDVQLFLKDPLGDGGWWTYAVDLIEKYGVIPQEAMPETHNSENSRWLNKTLEYLARQDAARLRRGAAAGVKENELRQQKVDMLKTVYRLLVLYLGTPPEEFTWRYQDKDKAIHHHPYTPLQYYREVVGIDLREYVTIFDHPVHPYQKYYQVRYRRNMSDKPDMDFINLAIDSLKSFSLKSLLNNEPVWFAADVGWNMERSKGIMADGIYNYQALLGYRDEMSKADRVQYHASAANHAMALVSVDTLKGKALKWRVENSWGTDTGDKGYFTLYDSWFDAYVFTVIIHQKYLPDKVLSLLKTKPQLLPNWDPLARPMIDDPE